MVVQYELELSKLRNEIDILFQLHPDRKIKQQEVLQKHSLYAQHQAIERLLKEEIISSEIANHQQETITHQLVKLE